MTTDANDPQPAESPAAETGGPVHHPGNPLGRAGRRIIGAHVGRVPVGGILAAVAVVALLASAYYIGTPRAAHDSLTDSSNGQRFSANAPVAAPVPAALPGAVNDQSGGDQKSLQFGADTGTGTTTPFDQLTATLETTQIVKTGSMAIEVADLDKAVSAAQAAIIGMGGSVSDSSRSGDKDSAVATITYRVPVARWDDALSAIRGLGSRLLNEQTNATDVTAQVIDLDARLDNLTVTQTALKSIMARASAIPDVLAVEQQLSNVEGQIEQLTAQRDHLKNQAALSTLSVSFSTPGKTVTTLAASDWALGAQVDEAVAALVHIGQGLATIVVWAAIVGLPIVAALAILWLIWRIMRRITRRRGAVATGA
jgi:hypothetical protein